ncbi:hypothetical protein FRB90_001553 [Tulasnella sp. 427]|nr:hypothetical protein FRB90_001553 [Tulasnella sp. 427]
MMSEPLRPVPPPTSGPSGKPTAKRKLDTYAEEEASANPGSSQSRGVGETTGTKKKARVGGIPKGFQIKQVASTTSISVGLSQEVSEDLDRPSTSRSQLLNISPPPNRHPSPVNPDDRPLPAPRDPLWVNQPSADRTIPEKRTKPPSTTGRASNKPPSSSASRYSVLGTSKGKGKEVIRAATPPEELEKLQELRGQIDMIEGERQSDDQRRNGSRPASTSTAKSIARAPFASRAKPSSTPAHASSTKSHAPVFRPILSSGNSSESVESRRGLHNSTSTVPVALNDTPMIKKNREMRKEQSERRKSSMGQVSARVTESFGAGILANPHPSVDYPDFYTHISPELPEALRIRQLLAWCSSRAQSSTSSPSAPSTSEPLPKLKSSQQIVLRELQDELMKMLCLGKVDTSISLSDSDSPTSGRRKQKVKEHPRNVINRAQEAEFIKSEAAANAEEVAWSEMVQSLNNKQVNVLNSLEKRRDKVKEAEEDFLSRWERSRKGKEKLDPDATDEMGPGDEKEARVLSSIWNIPPDAFRSSRDARFKESLGLVEEELSLRGKPSLLDHDEGKLAQRLGRLEMLVDEIAAGAHVATTLASSASSDLTAFAKTLASRFNSRIPLGILPTSTSATESSGTSALGMMQPSSSPAFFTDPLAKLSVLSTAKPVDAEVGMSDAAKRAALELEKGVAGRKLTAIPATPNSRRTPRKSAGRAGK